MGLESGTRIEDLNTANPTTGDPVSQGDDHLRLLKTCITGSFPSLGSTAVAATAEQINELTDISNNFVTSFEGRTGVVTAASGDYGLGQIDGVTLGGLADGDVLRYNAGTVEFENKPFIYGYAHYNTRTGSVGDMPYFTNAHANSIPAALGTIDNTGAGGHGWEYLAVLPCMVTVSFTAASTDGNSGTDTLRAAINRNRGLTTLSTDSAASCLAYSEMVVPEGGLGDPFICNVHVSASCTLAAGQTIRIYYELNGATMNEDDSRFTVTLSAWSLPE